MLLSTAAVTVAQDLHSGTAHVAALLILPVQLILVIWPIQRHTPVSILPQSSGHADDERSSLFAEVEHGTILIAMTDDVTDVCIDETVEQSQMQIRKSDLFHTSSIPQILVKYNLLCSWNVSRH